MKHITAIAFLGAVLACKTPVPSNSMEGAGTRNKADGVVPAGDSALRSGTADMTESLDSDSAVAEVLAPDVTGAVADAVDAGIDGVQGDASPDSAFKPLPCVNDFVPGLPNPGDSCTKPGAKRCTDHQAKLAGSALEADSILNYCFRPNYVECQADNNGKLVWMVKTCDALGKSQASQEAAGKCPYWMRCLDNGTGMVCVKDSVATVAQPALPFYSCRSDVVGKTACKSHVSECQLFKNGTFHTQSAEPHIDTGPDPLGICAPFAEGGTYWVPHHQCNQVFANCPKFGQDTSSMCDLYGGVYRCSKTCEEALAFWAKQPKPDSP